MPLLALRTPPPIPPLATPSALCNILLSATRALPQGQQLHAHLLKSGAIPSSTTRSATAPLSNHLITFYARYGLPLLSRRAFLDLPSSPRPPAPAWSAVLFALAQNDLPVDALATFRSMLLVDVPPSDRTLPSATKKCAALALPSLSCSLHALALKTPFHADVFVASAVVDMYAKCTLLPDAHQFFDRDALTQRRLLKSPHLLPRLGRPRRRRLKPLQGRPRGTRHRPERLHLLLRRSRLQHRHPPRPRLPGPRPLCQVQLRHLPLRRQLSRISVLKMRPR